jgi:two-component system LytT family sensor kinase
MQTEGRINYKTVVQHLAFWGALILYQAISYGWEYTDEFSFKLAPNLVTAGIPVTIMLTYINLYVLMPAYYYRQQYGRYALAMLFLLLAGGLLVRFLTYEFVIPWERLHNPERYRQENKHFWIPVRILRISLEPYPIIALTMLLKLMNNAYLGQKNPRASAFIAPISFRSNISMHIMQHRLRSEKPACRSAAPT